MKNVYKAHILFTKEKDRFEVFENGYIAVTTPCAQGCLENLSWDMRKLWTSLFHQ